MKVIKKMRKYDILLNSKFVTYYTAVAESEERVIEMLREELSKNNTYTVDDFEIEDMGPAKDQMGGYFEERFTNEME